MGLEDLPTTGPTDDLSSIAWVHEELRRSLEAAHKSLRRFLKDAEAVTGSDIDSVDPGVLRAARSQIHQGVGALELVGLPAAAIVLRASETAVQRAIAKPPSLTPELVVRSRARVVRPARLPVAPARRQAGLVALALSARTARCRRRSRPNASIRPTCGRSTGAGARSRAIPTSSPRQADATVRAEFEKPPACTHARHAGAHRRRQDERDLRRPRAPARPIRRCARSGISPRRCSRRSTTACSASTSSPSASPRACSPSSACSSAATPTSPSGSRATSCSSAPRPRPPDATSACRAWPPCATPTASSSRSRPTTRTACSAASTRRSSRTRRSASPPRRKPGRRPPAASCTGSAACSEQFALVGDSLRTPVPVRRDVRRRTARRGRSRPSRRRRHRRRRWRWRSRPACSISRPRSTTATSIFPSTPSGSKRLAERLAAVRQKHAARAARAVDGGALSARLRPPDDGQRRPGAARLAGRSREVDRQVLPQPGRPQRAARRAGASSARCAACSRCSAWSRRHRRCCACATRSTGWSSTEVDPGADRSGRRLRAPRRQPVGARLHDRHAERAAAAWRSRSSSTTPTRERWRPSWGAARHRTRPSVPRPSSRALSSRRRCSPSPRCATTCRSRRSTRDLERLSARSAGGRPARARRRSAEGAGGARQGARARGRRERARRALGSAGRFRRDLDRAGGIRAGQRAGAARADGADHARRGLRARRRDARGLPRGGARGHRRRRAARTRSCTTRPSDLGPADDAAPRLPHPQGQLAHGRPEGLRRSGLGRASRCSTRSSPSSAPPSRRCSSSPPGRSTISSAWVDDIAAQAPRGPQRARGADRGRQAVARRQRRRGAVRHRAADRLARRPAESAGPRSQPPAPAAAVAQPPLEHAEDLSFELDLSGLDQLVEPEPRRVLHPSSRCRRAADASAMFDRFDDARSADMQTTLSNEEFDARCVRIVDLDLGSPVEPRRADPEPRAERRSGARARRRPRRSSPRPGQRRRGRRRRGAGASGAVDLEIEAGTAQRGELGDEHVKIVGPLRIGIPLFNIYLNEADELSRRL